jgi:hypothetical protein
MLEGTSSKNSVDKLAVLIAEHFKKNERHDFMFFYLKMANGWKAKILHTHRDHRFHFTGLYNPMIGLVKDDFSSSSLREVCIKLKGTKYISVKNMLYVNTLGASDTEISIGFFEHFGTIIFIICILRIIF